MLKKNLNTVFFLIVIGVVFFSCKKNFKPNWDVDLLAPIVKTTLSLDDLLPDSIIQTNPDTSVKLVYNTNLIDIDLDSIFKLPDTTFVENFSPSFGINANPGMTFYSNNEEVVLKVNNGVELDYLIIESGFIDLEIESTIQERTIVTYTIQSATKGGVVLQVQEEVDAATPGQNATFKKRYNLSGYELDLTGVSQVEVNTVVTKAEAMIHPNGNPITVNPTDKIIFRNKLVDIVPYYGHGYFGKNSFKFGPENTKFNAFNRILAGTLDLEQVSVNLNFENGIGVDAQLKVNNLAAVNTKNATTIPLTHSIIGNQININRASETYNVPEVNYTNYNIPITTNNSNIDNLIEVFPNQLSYEMEVVVNPLGNVSGGNDFLFKKHPLQANINAELPLSLIANNLTLADTIDLNIKSDKNKSEIIDGNLTIYADNGYPFNANIELVLLDENSNVIDNIATSNNILAGTVNSSLRVTNKTSSVINIPLSETNVDNVYSASKIVLKIAFTTIAQPQFIKIYDYYDIDIQVVADFAYNVNLQSE